MLARPVLPFDHISATILAPGDMANDDGSSLIFSMSRSASEDLRLGAGRTFSGAALPAHIDE
jgi:hypothetical protein